MNFNMKNIISSLTVAALIIIAFLVYISFAPEKEINTTLINMDYELGIIKSDLQTYNKLSDNVIEVILSALKETAIKDTLPVGLLHCINRVESEYQYNIVHPTVTVSYKGKMLTTNAVGTGGILWCYWGDSLKARNIAQTEMDLFFPDKSIRGTGFILRYMINDEIRIAKRNGQRITSNNILARVVKRYYGAYSEQYLGRMQSITSDLWMKRMAQDIINEKDTAYNHVIINKETMKINKKLENFIDKNIKNKKTN